MTIEEAKRLKEQLKGKTVRGLGYSSHGNEQTNEILALSIYFEDGSELKLFPGFGVQELGDEEGGVLIQCWRLRQPSTTKETP